MFFNGTLLMDDDSHNLFPCAFNDGVGLSGLVVDTLLGQEW